MSLNKPQAILFDLDGTLLDTSAGISHSVRFTARQMGLGEIADKDIASFIGPPIEVSFRNHWHLDAERLPEAAAVFRNNYRSESLFMAQPYPGIEPLLSLLQQSGIRVGVATYKRESYALRILSHFGLTEYLSVAHGSDEEGLMNKADIIKCCLSEMGEVGNNAIYVGDTEHDAKGAAMAGIPFIAVSWGFGFCDGITPTNYPCAGMAHSPAEIAILCGLSQ
ncbi:MAG: HAD hydrolase-like protein [Bacteroidales bacterium]|nr:HAD hydrolase-like protein [Bacteroidales bacterium]